MRRGGDAISSAQHGNTLFLASSLTEISKRQRRVRSAVSNGTGLIFSSLPLWGQRVAERERSLAAIFSN